jgi:hypothetical protein
LMTRMIRRLDGEIATLKGFGSYPARVRAYRDKNAQPGSHTTA